MSCPRGTDCGGYTLVVGVTARLIYLDQHIWVRLLQGIKTLDPTAKLVQELLTAQRDADTTRVPLSGAHYLETWHRRDEQSRHELAGLMRDISRYDSLAAVHTIERASVAWEICRLSRREPIGPEPSSLVLGRGVNHAFDSPIGRFRVVSSIATDTTPEGPLLDPPQGLAEVAERGGEVWEWFNLAGSDELFQRDGIDVRPEHRLGRTQASDELELRRLLLEDKVLRGRLEDLIITQEMVRILDYVNLVCRYLNVDPVALFIEDNPGSIRSFVRAVPVTNMRYRLRLHRHRDAGYPIEQHDRTDLHALALAVPYCDVVVTEKRWSHAIRAARLDSLYNTKICASLKELAAVLST
jgi:hypothetical protein